MLRHDDATGGETMSWLAEVLPIAVLLLMYTLLWLEKRKVRRAADEESPAA